LKFASVRNRLLENRSLPTRGAWIEMRPGAIISTHAARSLPTRGAWIEIQWYDNYDCIRKSLPTRGAWIEMTLAQTPRLSEDGRSPHGERGLKFHGKRAKPFGYRSLPTRGAWIEIWAKWHCKALKRSLPTRGAWIEMTIRVCKIVPLNVAPHTGSVD